ncbi:SDR family NAD(P)-dependent oxidoreductase [Cohnella soli]|uniref:SDR family NAD(P)-dependent oxidoreductase n=1 Tax=Cohnella soli TaxID=425005 RepID=A0ABW0I293_9BACL
MSRTYSEYKGVALVTGASSGIGWKTVVRLLREGYYVFAHQRKAVPPRDLDELPISDRESLTFLSCDLDDTDSVMEWIQKDLREIPIQILINNAGKASKIDFENISAFEWESVFRVNVIAPFLLSQWAFQSMKARRSGGILVHVSSMASIPNAEKFHGFTAYTASKYALAGLSENIASEGRGLGIYSVCISPGAVRTKMMEQMVPEAASWMEPEEVAVFIASLVRDFPALCNGTNIILK